LGPLRGYIMSTSGRLKIKIMITKMFAIWDKTKPDIESIRSLHLAAVKHTTVQVTRLPL
jgi:hypothetical protein